MKKNKSIAILLAVIIVIAALGAYAVNVISATGNSEEKNGIILGLDLAGGVSITYQIADENPSDEDVSDTIYKLQRRVESYSTEASVYKSGSDRINIEIPGVTDANEILEDLGSPGTLYFCDPEGVPFISGEQIEDAQAGTYKDDYGNNAYCVDLVLNDEAAETFYQMTSAHIGEQLPIVYDEEVISAPKVQAAISGGKAQITGSFTYDEAARLASQIRIGSLSLELVELESQVVGAQMGSNAMNTALKAGIIGLVIIIIFMICYYWLSGVAAALALLLYSAAVICTVQLFGITLTLPGIAGIILGIGMAVDANVVIYGRIREEIATGKSTFNSMRDGFKRASSAIIDGNITTLIAAAVLAWKGSGTVKGFAYTLALGIIISIITSLFVTRYVMYALCGVGFKDAKYYGKQKERKTIAFTKRRVIFYVIAVVCILSGFVGMGANKSAGKGALNLSLEFVGGTSNTVYFDKDYTIEEVEAEMVPLVAEVTGDNNIQIQKVQDSTGVIFKTRTLSLEEREAFNKVFVDTYSIDENTIESQSISSTISSEMTRDAVIAVIIAVILMMIYIAFRFQDIRFASSAVLALIHDILLVLASYALLRISVGSAFIAVMLTILGYSINDTIVVFDRVRENIRNRAKVSVDELTEIADKSVTQTLARSINTSVTTFIMVLLLYILGVASIKDFSLPLMVGIVAGLFSSVCLSTNMWYGFKLHIGGKSKK
ncbi:MAG: protein translocase subunit SecD [Lachnospiraceae bacterium]|nr:protein translocase subunit SecD [Lachnospiraceae bacterium]